MFPLKVRPLVAAHRGCSDTFPENTLVAFRRAIEVGIDMIELDIQCSSDGKVIVFHDHRINRTTNGRGKISTFTLRELQNFDVGSWFHPQFSNEIIPTLRDVLKICQGRIKLIIEVKSYGNDAKYNFIVEKSIKLVKEFGMENDVLFTSFDHNLLHEFFDYNTQLQRGINYDTHRHIRKSPSSLCKMSCADTFVCDIKTLKKNLITDVRSNKLYLGAYNIVSEADFEKAMKSDVDFIITDIPEQVTRWLGRGK
ncbi:MAG: hypothetical protein FJ218_07555 [Ignavibacteria bacterium]|nr:hypothetical protein [Ignavibacteria bacterium]